MTWIVGILLFAIAARRLVSGLSGLSGLTGIFGEGSPAPTLSSFTPTGQRSGGAIVITGTNFTGATAVTIGGVNVTSFVVNGPTQITATIDGTIRSGTVAVTTPGGTTTSAGTAYLIGTPLISQDSVLGVLNGSGIPAAPTETVGTWTNQGTNGASPAQGTDANRPIYTANVQNSLRGLVFDGSNDFMSTSAFTSIAQPSTMYLCGKLANATEPVCLVDGPASHQNRLQRSGGFWNLFSGGGSAGGAIAADTTFHLLNAIWSGATSKFSVDGSADESLTLLGTNDLTQLFIGSRNTGANNAALSITDLHWYAGTHDATTRAIIKAYLNSKLAIY